MEGQIFMNENLWRKCIEFHGHECPGLAICYRASDILADAWITRDYGYGNHH